MLFLHRRFFARMKVDYSKKQKNFSLLHEISPINERFDLK